MVSGSCPMSLQGWAVLGSLRTGAVPSFLQVQRDYAIYAAPKAGAGRPSLVFFCLGCSQDPTKFWDKTGNPFAFDSLFGFVPGQL